MTTLIQNAESAASTVANVAETAVTTTVSTVKRGASTVAHAAHAVEKRLLSLPLRSGVTLGEELSAALDEAKKIGPEAESIVVRIGAIQAALSAFGLTPAVELALLESVV